MKNSLSRSIFVLLITAIVAISFSSCSKERDYRGAIPTNASIVMEFDMQSLTLKSNILSYKGIIADAIASDEDDEMILELAERIRKADDGGLNFENPVYAFMPSDAGGLFVVVAVKDKAEVVKMFTETMEHIRLIDDEGQGQTRIELGSDQIGCLTDKVLLLGFAKDDNLFNEYIACEGDFFDTKMGAELKAHAGDMTLMLDLSQMNEQLIEDMLREMDLRSLMRELGRAFDEKSLMNQIRNLQMVMNLKFLRGELSLNIHVVTDQKNDGLKKIDPSIFDVIASDNLLVMMAIGIDGPVLSDAMQSKFAQMDQQSLENDARMGLQLITSFISQINGSSAFGLYLTGADDPGIIGVLPMEPSRLQFIVNIIRENMDFPLYQFGDKSYSVLTNMANYSKTPSAMPEGVKEHAAASYLYGYLDLKTIVQLILESKGMYEYSEKKQLVYEMIDDFMSNVNYAEIKMEQMNELSFVIQLNDNSRNSLDMIVSKGFQYIVSYFLYEKELQARDEEEDLFLDEWSNAVDTLETDESEEEYFY